jgi:hypothetical protein
MLSRCALLGVERGQKVGIPGGKTVAHVGGIRATGATHLCLELTGNARSVGSRAGPTRSRMVLAAKTTRKPSLDADEIWRDDGRCPFSS